jgi:hypothetical protein
MSRARAAIDVPDVRIADVEALWYDRARWPSFVDGLKHVHAVEGDYPNPGAAVKWESHSGGRGRVLERVVAYTAREGQELDVQDSQIRGRQAVRFTALEDGVHIELELDYAIKDRTPLTPLIDLLFVRRAQTDSLRRTLARFARELQDEHFH